MKCAHDNVRVRNSLCEIPHSFALSVCLLTGLICMKGGKVYSVCFNSTRKKAALMSSTDAKNTNCAELSPTSLRMLELREEVLDE